MTRVSVIIPAYNPGAMLQRALRSVIAQSLQDWEAVVLDDGSEEDLSWVGSVDPRVRLVTQSNRGVSAARNSALAMSGAPLVAYLDQDDEWLADKLTRQVDALGRQPEAVLSYTDFDWVWSDERRQPGVYHEPVTYNGLLNDQHLCLSTVVVRRGAVLEAGGFSPLLAQMQDYDLFLRLAMRGAPLLRVPAVLALYHLHDNNVSADYLAARAERLEVLGAHRRRAAKVGDARALAEIAQGRRRTRTLYGAQAYDRFRAAVGAREATWAPHLARALAWSPAYTLGALRGSVRRRLSRHRSDAH